MPNIMAFVFDIDPVTNARLRVRSIFLSMSRSYKLLNTQAEAMTKDNPTKVAKSSRQFMCPLDAKKNPAIVVIALP